MDVHVFQHGDLPGMCGWVDGFAVEKSKEFYDLTILHSHACVPECFVGEAVLPE